MQRVWELEQLNLKKADPVAWAAEQERLEKYRQRRAAARLKKKMREAAEERELTLCAMRKSVGSPFVPLTVLKGKCLLDWAGEALSQEWRRASDQRGNTYQRELNR